MAAPATPAHPPKETSPVADFTHLHVHSEYSLLDGQSRIERLIAQTKAAGMQALALTDHGGMYGAIEFYKKAQEQGIKPILGVEAYLAPSIEDKTGRYEYNHLLLLARDQVGYQNLLKLTTIAHTRGYHYRPRVDKQVLERHAAGLIVTSGCLSGEIPELLLGGDLNGARAAVRWYRDVFGHKNFYLEVQDHQAAESPQGKLNQLLYDLHRETGAPLLATNDLHYVRAGDAEAQDILLCVQTGKTLDEPKRMKFDSDQYYLKTPEEMARLFPELPEALANTMRVAEQCNVAIEFGRNLQPHYPIPPGFATQYDYLRWLCEQGVHERYGEMTDPVRHRLEYELDIIHSKGFIWYFLVVWDFVNHARTQGIRCSARGSGAGSLVGYVLGITSVDPLRYDLLFERFLNPERMSMPDLDMDFPDDRREDVIVYVAEKYGWEKVAQIVTFNTMAAKAAIRDVGRVMGIPNEADRVARLIPAGPKVTLKGSLENVKELRQAYEQSAQIRRLVDRALDLEGTVRGTGIHAAGVVISCESLDEVVPLQLRDSKDPKSWLVSQYEQAHLEELGLLKMDFLGLSNLTTLHNTQRFIKQTHGIDIDLDRLPVDDTKAFELLASGETTGIFQLESGAMRSYIKELRPTCLEDLTAMVALYRPGPMDAIPTFIKAKHGEIQIKYLHPDLEPYLRESYGVIVYQDQVLQIAVHLAGFSWGEVDKFRKAMGKKLASELKAYREKFIKGCVMRGIDAKIADQIFTLIEPFGGYGFNKAHACSYAWVAYQTAYLKANYTAEFMAATLTTEASDAKKVVAAVAECRRMGVEVLPPDVNRSESGFSVEALPATGTDGGLDGGAYGPGAVGARGPGAARPLQAVRFGLLAIKNVGPRPVEEILQARRSGGPFRSLADLCARTDAKAVTRGALECLIKAGALDELGRRSQLLAALDRAVLLGQQMRKMREVGQSSLFTSAAGGDGHGGHADFHLPAVPDHPQQELLAWEKELLNVYLSAHPLAHVATALKRRATAYTENLTEEWVGQSVTMGGRIVSVRRIMTRKGDAMAAVQLEDMLGNIEVMVFPRIYGETAERWREDAIVLVHGTIKLREDEPQLVCDSVEELVVTAEEANRREYLLRVRLKRTGNETLDKVRAQDALTILRKFPGDDRYALLVQNGKWVAQLAPGAGELGVRYCAELQQHLEELLGPGAVQALPLPTPAPGAELAAR
jgi:DNA polymerase III subunit alpha